MTMWISRWAGESGTFAHTAASEESVKIAFVVAKKSVRKIACHRDGEFTQACYPGIGHLF